MINSFISDFSNIKNVDFLRTLVRFTAESIIHSLKYIKNISFENSSLIISGGGIRIKLLLSDIKEIRIKKNTRYFFSNCYFLI